MRLSAFISSSIVEFGPEEKLDSTRRKLAALLEEFHVGPVMWELWTKPASMTPKEFYQMYLQDCQLYIGIIGLQESPGTEDEYRESRILQLERWIFIYEPKGSYSRHPQMQVLADLANSETVRVNFGSTDQLLKTVRSKLEDFLPEKVAEYIELRKKRAHEFWSSYIRDFLEPVLTELKVIREELNRDASYFMTDSWRQLRKKPASDLDKDITNKIEQAYNALDDYQKKWSLAYGVFQKRADEIVPRHIPSPTNAALCKDIILANHPALINVAIQPDIPQRWNKMVDFPQVLYAKIDALSAPGVGDKLIGEFVGGISLTGEYKALQESHKRAVEKMEDAYEALWAKFTELVGQ